MTYQSGETNAQNTEELRRYSVEELRRVETDSQIVANRLAALEATKVESRYGSLRQGTTPQAFPDIGAAYQTLTVLDTAETEKGTTIEPTTHSIQLEKAGVYLMTINLSFDHNELNAGRTFYLQLWDGASQVGNTYQVGVGRNVEISNVSISALPDVQTTGVAMVLRIGGGDSFSQVSFNSASWGFVYQDA